VPCGSVSRCGRRPGEALDAFLAEGRQGDMVWLATTATPKAPRLWPGRKRHRARIELRAHGRSLAIMGRSRGAISIYAQGDDYHDVLKAKLKPLAARVQELAQSEVKIFVDTAPVMEKPLAARAGLGWQGKHTNLVSRELGSWLFIGAIFTTAEIDPDAAEEDHCGACRRCLDICPTHAFTAPIRSTRALASPISPSSTGDTSRRAFAPRWGAFFGCDDCLAVCPWNKFAQSAREAKLAGRAGSDNPPLAELLILDDAAFRARYRGTPIKRTGRDRFMRNVLIAAGNSGDTTLAPVVEARLGDQSPLVRAMAVWALARLAPRRFNALRGSHCAGETDPAVRSEWLEEAA
jgi:epoxyqueuosine reductase